MHYYDSQSIVWVAAVFRLKQAACAPCCNSASNKATKLNFTLGKFRPSAERSTGCQKVKTKAKASVQLCKGVTSEKGLGWGRAEWIRVKKGPNLADRLGLLFKGAFARIHVDGGTSELDDLKLNDLIRAIFSALG